MSDMKQNGIENFWDPSRTLPWADGAKKIAAWYIDVTESLARIALDFQSKGCDWAKDTPFARLFEAQQSMGQRFTDLWISTARQLCQIEQSGKA